MKASKLLFQMEVSDYIDYPRIFFCHDLSGDEAYLMICPEFMEYEMYDDAVAEDYYYQDEELKKLYIDIGDSVVVTYFTVKGLEHARGTISDIDWEEKEIYLNNGITIGGDSIESIGLI